MQLIAGFQFHLLIQLLFPKIGRNLYWSSLKRPLQYYMELILQTFATGYLAQIFQIQETMKLQHIYQYKITYFVSKLLNL